MSVSAAIADSPLRQAWTRSAGEGQWNRRIPSEVFTREPGIGS